MKIKLNYIKSKIEERTCGGEKKKHTYVICMYAYTYVKKHIYIYIYIYIYI